MKIKKEINSKKKYLFKTEVIIQELNFIMNYIKIKQFITNLY